jgi:hypothetical protein
VSIEASVEGVLERDDGDSGRRDKLSDAASSELLSNSGPELLTMSVSGVVPEGSSDSAWNLLAIVLFAGLFLGMSKVFRQVIVLQRREGKCKLGRGDSPPILRQKRPRKNLTRLSQSDRRN